MDKTTEQQHYYIPCSTLGKIEQPIHYVALYQTKKLFGAGAGVKLYGEVISMSKVKRSSITEVPFRPKSRGDEPYYRFQVAEWKALNPVIEPKQSGFVREFTNMFLLEHAQYVPELLIRTETEYRLYYELRRRTGKDMDDNKAENGFMLDGITCVIDGDKITLDKGLNHVDGWVRAFKDNPTAVLRVLLKTLA